MFLAPRYEGLWNYLKTPPTIDSSIDSSELQDMVLYVLRYLRWAIYHDYVHWSFGFGDVNYWNSINKSDMSAGSPPTNLAVINCPNPHNFSLPGSGHGGNLSPMAIAIPQWKHHDFSIWKAHQNQDFLRMAFDHLTTNPRPRPQTKYKQLCQDFARSEISGQN